MKINEKKFVGERINKMETREIKFKFEHLGEIFDVIEIHFKERKVLVDNGDWFSFDLGHPIQFTGLKDKNGKEIFEGDIIEFVYKVGDKIRCEIKWVDDECKFKWINKDWNVDLLKSKGYEVIGNKFENPELLDLEELEKEK